VWTLRKALDDDNGEHRYVETVPKRGYRFLAPVREVPSEDTGVLIQRRVRARIVSEEEETSDGPQVGTNVTMPTRPIAETTALSIAAEQNRTRRTAALGLLAVAGLIAA